MAKLRDISADELLLAYTKVEVVREVEELRRERDLALAHDTQPYPTADAYEKVCAALEKAKYERDFWAWKYERREAECEELATQIKELATQIVDTQKALAATAKSWREARGTPESRREGREYADRLTELLPDRETEGPQVPGGGS
jgi:hypothetical protein